MGGYNTRHSGRDRSVKVGHEIITQKSLGIHGKFSFSKANRCHFVQVKCSSIWCSFLVVTANFAKYFGGLFLDVGYKQ